MTQLQVPTIDLLHPEPLGRSANLDELYTALTFAFAQGQVGDIFQKAFTELPLESSTFDAKHFGQDLFLDVFRRQCLRIRIENRDYDPHGGWLHRLLTHVPSRLTTTQFRQRSFGELCQHPELRRSLEQLYRRVRHLRDLLTRSGGAAHSEPDQRRLDILRTIYQLGSNLAAFEGSTSAFARLSELGRMLCSNPAYARVAQLINYEAESASVSACVTLGYDGRIRECRVLDVNHNAEHPAQLSAVQRFWERLRLFLGGYRTSPLELLRHCMIELFEELSPLVLALMQVMGDLEFYLSGMWFRDSLIASGYQACLPEFHLGRARTLVDLANPLLIAEGVSVKPCSVHIPEKSRITLLTGPNSGGKTRLLQVLALSQILAQVGLFVPASRAVLPWTGSVFASLVERTTAGQSEGRLGTELLRIREVFAAAEPGSMIVLDELCSGTNPREGEEIFRMVLRLLEELAPDAFISTHFLDFVEGLDSTQAALNFLQVELDANRLPTYGFVQGVANTSLANQLAERLGATEPELRRLMTARQRGKNIADISAPTNSSARGPWGVHPA